jgi:hypothetical protein
MSKILKIVENFPLDKFEGLTKLIISLRGKFNAIALNNKNGYIRVADGDGNLFISRTLLKHSPERAKEVEKILTEITYEMAEGSLGLLLKKRQIANHEKNKNPEEITCAGVEFDGRFFGGGGLLAHENLALVVLFPVFAVEEYFSPSPVPNVYLEHTGNLLAQIMNKAEIRTSDSDTYKKSLDVIDEIFINKRTIWPTRVMLTKK